MKRLSLIYTLLFVAGLFLFVPEIGIGRADAFGNWLLDKNAGAAAADFTLKDMSGKDVSLSSFKGKPVLLNFWATWCPWCRKERAHLNTIYNDYKDKGLIVISVSTDRSLKKVKNYLKKIPADFIVLSDSNGNVSSSFGVQGLPTSFLINSDGVIENKFVGFREWSSSGSRKLLDKLIDNK